MAKYLTLTHEIVGDERRVEVLAFLPVPEGSNAVGVTWRAAVAGYVTYRNRRHNRGTQATLPVDQETQDQLDTGALMEVRVPVAMPATTTDPQAVLAINEAVNAKAATLNAELGALLRYWGHQGDSG